ncbi:hypothetical protein QAD02_010768 [Eretmocerus hayati]|uniref:Uncharacterized protein n=1 Tax=Eretmocerus hayati TaxID=131215 RepID=A0ACC2NXQ1_9HYME|nr:hypothetical protein QAD02_010768 [Eretmocerus hayati]
MERDSDSFIPLMREKEIVFGELKSADNRSRKALVEMIQMLKHSGKLDDVRDELLPSLEELLIDIEKSIERVEYWESRVTKAVEERYKDIDKTKTKVLLHLDKLFLEAKNAELDEKEFDDDIINKLIFDIAREQIIEISKYEPDLFGVFDSSQENKKDHARQLEFYLSKLKIKANIH